MSNSKMITVEDYNSIIEHFNHGFIDYYTFDTSEKNDNIYSYDFLTIQKNPNNVNVMVENDLWTGGYYLISSSGTDNVVSEVNNKIIQFSGTGLKDVCFVLELSPEITRSQKLIDYKVRYPVYVRPFYNSFSIEVYFKTLEDEPYVNLPVRDGVNTYRTDSEGKVYIPISGDEKSGHHNHLIKVNNDEINLYYRRMKAEYRVGLESVIYRYMKTRCTFKLYFNNNQSMYENLFYNNNDIYLLINGKRYDIVGHNLNEMYFDLPAFSSESLDIRFVMGGNEYIDAVKYDYTVELPIKEYSSSDDLIRDCQSGINPAIVKFTGTDDISLLLHNDIKIIFTEVRESVYCSMSIINCKVTLENLNINEPRDKITLRGGELELKDCSFTHSSDSIIRGTGNVILSNVSFVDNVACIDITGDLTANNCVFELADNSYVNITKIPFIKVFGDININSTIFNIELSDLDELGYSYVAMMINDKNTTNNVNNNKLTSNNNFNMLNNTGNISVSGNNYNINATFTWTIQNTNTVFGNNLKVIQE